jgi:hypothetical protein
MQQVDELDICLLNSYWISDIIDECSNKMYSETTLGSTDNAEHLLQRLKTWSDGMPDSLRTSSMFFGQG